MRKLLFTLIALVGLTASAQTQKFGDYTGSVYDSGTARVRTDSVLTVSGTIRFMKFETYRWLDSGRYNVYFEKYEEMDETTIFEISFMIDGDVSTLKTVIAKGGSYGNLFFPIEDFYSMDELRYATNLFVRIKGEVYVVSMIGFVEASEFAEYELEKKYRSTLPNPFDTGDIDGSSSYEDFFINFNPNSDSIQSYLDMFVEDALINHQLDLSWVYNRIIKFEFKTRAEVEILYPNEDSSRTLAYTTARNKDNIHVVVVIDDWYSYSNAGRAAVLYHEFGHDIFNFPHGTGGPIMNPSGRTNYSAYELYILKSRLFESYKELNNL